MLNSPHSRLLRRKWCPSCFWSANSWYLSSGNANDGRVHQRIANLTWLRFPFVKKNRLVIWYGKSKIEVDHCQRETNYRAASLPSFPFQQNGPHKSWAELGNFKSATQENVTLCPVALRKTWPMDQWGKKHNEDSESKWYHHLLSHPKCSPSTIFLIIQQPGKLLSHTLW